MHKKSASICIKLYEDDKHNLDDINLQNLEVEPDTLAPVDHHEGRHYLHLVV
jgi:hypothetical protein